MKVSDLGRHLTDLRSMLEVAGAKGSVLTDLAAISNGLIPFREYPLSDFADFLVRAEAFSRGEVPVIPPRKAAAPKQPRAPKQPKAPAPDAGALGQEARRLYDHASESTVTVVAIEDLIARVSKLEKKGMIEVALALELKFAGTGPTKGKIADQIRKRILDRKGSFQRAGLLDREASSNHSAETAIP